MSNSEPEKLLGLAFIVPQNFEPFTCIFDVQLFGVGIVGAMPSLRVINKFPVGVSGFTFVVDNFFEFAAVTGLALHWLTLKIRVPSFLALNWFHV
jgi:hypothetical protein